MSRDSHRTSNVFTASTLPACSATPIEVCCLFLSNSFHRYSCRFSESPSSLSMLLLVFHHTFPLISIMASLPLLLTSSILMPGTHRTKTTRGQELRLEVKSLSVFSTYSAHLFCMSYDTRMTTSATTKATTTLPTGCSAPIHVRH